MSGDPWLPSPVSMESADSSAIGMDMYVLSSILLIFPALAFAAGGGIGGGAMVVPILIFIGQLHANYVVAGANMFILAGSIVNIAFAVTRRKPDGTPLIDYNVVVALEPSTIAGSAAGALLSRIVGPAFITTLMVAVLAVTAWRTLSRYRTLVTAAPALPANPPVPMGAPGNAAGAMRTVGGVMVARSVPPVVRTLSELDDGLPAGASASPSEPSLSIDPGVVALPSSSPFVAAAAASTPVQEDDDFIVLDDDILDLGDDDDDLWEPRDLARWSHRFASGLARFGVPSLLTEFVAGWMEWVRWAWGPTPCPRDAMAAVAALRPSTVRDVPWLRLLYLAAIVLGNVYISSRRVTALEDGDVVQCNALLIAPIAWGVIHAVAVAWLLVRQSTVESRYAAYVASGARLPGDQSTHLRPDTSLVWTPSKGFVWPAFCSLAGVFAGLFGIGGGILKVR